MITPLYKFCLVSFVERRVCKLSTTLISDDATEYRHYKNIMLFHNLSLFVTLFHYISAEIIVFMTSEAAKANKVDIGMLSHKCQVVFVMIKCKKKTFKYIFRRFKKSCQCTFSVCNGSYTSFGNHTLAFSTLYNI